MTKDCNTCVFRNAGIPCPVNSDLCFGLETDLSADGGLALRVCAGANAEVERPRGELLEAIDQLLDSVFGEEETSFETAGVACSY
ncbi:MAG TPA: hypothetical protein VMB26_06465 [Candidatus Binataceae bacterium]|nr:hypothetical protein [Candidatus Binataceae bacterium]